ncbi:phosphatidylethanolamine-binding protein [Toxoplasma gondii VAND]|uniref:Phosphatidylethanolamine-binding protein n=1 Tax=Toxoplasma gondii VAND TaxID=933077 RepID=A0A086QJL6_TOXGO|nr:phosphatidylethanolamine-binding protein [Toxoplasma gondii VAND]
MGSPMRRRWMSSITVFFCVLKRISCQTDSEFRMENPDFGVPSCDDASSMALLPDKHFGSNCGDTNELPQLTWNDAPFDTGSFAVLVTDTSSNRMPFAHLIAWDIPVAVTSVGPQTNFSSIGAVSGTNDTGENGYSGPCPDKQACVKISVYALRPSTLGLSSSATYKELHKKLLELSANGGKDRDPRQFVQCKKAHTVLNWMQISWTLPACTQSQCLISTIRCGPRRETERLSCQRGWAIKRYGLKILLAFLTNSVAGTNSLATRRAFILPRAEHTQNDPIN